VVSGGGIGFMEFDEAFGGDWEAIWVIAGQVDDVRFRG
jgi:hypothetical protein